MKTLTLFLASATIVSMTPMPGTAQTPIRVTVDNEAVPFTGQQPVQKFGTVLVPLRGVFEKLGANVQYDAATKSILATKGTTTVSLQLGQSQASVNGQSRTLAVPAQATLGTTLVPLRFVSEALGADVKWEAQTRTVLIATGGVTAPNNNGGTGTASAEVSSFTLDGPATERPLRAGETLNVTLQGTPGANKAVFSIPGIKTAQNLPLKETSSGQYTGNFTIPEGTSIASGAVLANLTVNGAVSPVIQARQVLRVDAVGPTLASVTPQNGAELPPGKPLIYGTFSDAGTGVNTSTTKLLVNGKEVPDATITESFFSYRPETDLPVGKNTATIVVRDSAGNETRRDWSFTVTAQVSPIKALTVTPEGKTLEAGDVVTVRLEATPGGNAHFDIGGAITNRPLSESNGVYTGTYTIKKGDTLAKAPITVTYKNPSGKAFTQTADQSVTIAAGTPNAPTILTPTDAASVGDAATITGKATPGATVRVTVAFSGTLVIVPTQGTVTTQDVVADAQGNWKLELPKLDAPLGVRNLQYSATAVTVGAAGETSEAATVSFKR